MTDIVIHGFHLKNFKGIGQKGVRLGNLQKVNFLVGPNNAGKSSVLRYLSMYIDTQERRSDSIALLPEDVPLFSMNSEVVHGYAISLEDVLPKIDNNLAKKLLSTISCDGLIWISKRTEGRGFELTDWDGEKGESALDYHEWKSLWTYLTHQGGGDLNSSWIPQSIRKLAQDMPVPSPRVKFIPAMRQILPGDSFGDYSGTGLIEELSKHQNPDFDNQSLKKKFNAIEDFVRSVTGSEDARIEVPHARTHLVIHMGGKSLPLSALGTGIHEIVMLAAFCTLAEKHIVCLEEPEIHLHPLLQRKLIRYLASKTRNQYFIATHSSAMLDAAPAAVFSVYQEEGNTKIRLASSPSDRFEICRALGYQASDLLQSNAIIWVEGPSDRIYLLHWIKAAAPDLVEGIDFSIMFYGGRLLSHLCADDSEVDEFISLRRLNRNVAIVMDSDKSGSHSRVNRTKKRVSEEIGTDGYSWITRGREIENYIAPSMVPGIISGITKANAIQIPEPGPFDRAYCYTDEKGKSLEVDKIKLARAVAGQGANLDVLDLREKLSKLVTFIRNASAHRV